MKFTNIDYVAAAIAYEIIEQSYEIAPDGITYPETDTSISDWLIKYYDIERGPSFSLKIAQRLEKLGFFSTHNDTYAGTFIIADYNSFSNCWSKIASSYPESPYAAAALNGRRWLRAVFSNSKFWDDLEDNISDEQPNDSRNTYNEDEIILLEEDESYKTLIKGLKNIDTNLLRENSISNALGQDKDRIHSEISASQTILKSGSARKSVILNLIIKSIKEIIEKLKDKFYDKISEYGLEILLNCASRLLNIIN